MTQMRCITLFLLVFSAFLTACGDSSPSADENFVQDPSLCQFQQGACKQLVDGVGVSLTLYPEHAPSEENLQLAVNFDQTVNNVSYVVEGRDMFMGVIPGKLAASPVNNAQQLFEGNLIYGSCSSDYMIWRMTLNFETENGVQTAVFDFRADNPI
ncbi:hypothetical protein EXU30_19500 [Shewanella maritima]|uniref:Lipoprotein n=1 Tax=Shewanella maritima TaxID=2520507 RepID=A0A411PM82_9GAMM|nr:hypothetical protein [Shewanella maritima]QBF84611.1 hypothetical protein EXU30_19500 [Shewanella maritima]